MVSLDVWSKAVLNQTKHSRGIWSGRIGLDISIKLVYNKYFNWFPFSLPKHQHLKMNREPNS